MSYIYWNVINVEILAHSILAIMTRRTSTYISSTSEVCKVQVNEILITQNSQSVM